jgi:hypothetical protein
MQVLWKDRLLLCGRKVFPSSARQPRTPSPHALQFILISLHPCQYDEFDLQSVPRNVTVLTSSKVSLYFNFKNVEEPLMVPDVEPFDPVQIATVTSLSARENLRIGSIHRSPTRPGISLEKPNPFAVISTRAQSKLCRDFNDVLIKTPSVVSLETFSMVTWVSCKEFKDR